MLEGYKTYLFSAMAILATAAHTLGWLSQESLVTLLSIFVPAAQMTMRAAIGRVPKETQQEIVAPEQTRIKS